MKKSKNIQVQKFLEEMMMMDDQKYNILQALREIVLNIFPEVTERIIYWWIMFTLETDFWGIFSSKKHVSFEFTNWYLLQNPKKKLEWTWKFRRHLKIKSLSEVKEKDVDFYVKQINEFKKKDL